MDASATIRWKDAEGLTRALRAKLDTLQAIQVAAHWFGFYDVDLVDNDPGSYKIVATAHNRKVSAKGDTFEQAAEKMMEIFSQ